MLLVTELNLHRTWYLSVCKGQTLRYKPGQLGWAEEPEGGIGLGNGGRIRPSGSEQGLKASVVVREERAARAINGPVSGEQTFLRAREMCLSSHFESSPSCAMRGGSCHPHHPRSAGQDQFTPPESGCRGSVSGFGHASVPRKSLQNFIHSNFPELLLVVSIRTLQTLRDVAPLCTAFHVITTEHGRSCWIRRDY